MKLLSCRVFVICMVILLSNAVFAEDQWQQIFNGKNLDGWKPKISGYPFGDDQLKTFTVEDGYLTVSYKNYDGFENRFGHLFYQKKLSHYKLRFSYRFIGQQLPGGPEWAYKNSGVMLHGQTPESMSINQSFPVSIEAQLLGADEGATRTTANVCTPGTNVSIEQKPTTSHCNNSRSKSYSGEQWVRVEFEVEGNKLVKHRVNGELVLEYKDLVLEAPNNEHNLTVALDSGYISLQSESHPIQFKDIELLNMASD